MPFAACFKEIINRIFTIIAWTNIKYIYIVQNRAQFIIYIMGKYGEILDGGGDSDENFFLANNKINLFWVEGEFIVM